MSSVQLFGGALILLGTIIPRLTFASFVVASLIFLGFAVGRSVSITIDGKPNKQIIQGLVFEMVLGVANVYGIVSS